VQFYGWEFLTRTGVMIIIGLTAGSVWLGLRARVTETAPDDERPEDDIRAPGVAGNIRARVPQLVFAGVAMAIFVVAVVDALDQSFLGQVFPLLMATAGALFTAALILLLVVAPQGHVAAVDLERGRVPLAQGGPRSIVESLSWVALLVALTALVGFFAALVVFFVAFLQIRARASVLMTAVLTAGCAAFVLLLAGGLNLRFPGGWLQEMYRLPWPFS
jgi:putative tricarboxylic transport membrane protein